VIPGGKTKTQLAELTPAIWRKTDYPMKPGRLLFVLLFTIASFSGEGLAQQVESGANSVAGRKTNDKVVSDIDNTANPQTAIAYSGRLLGDGESVRLLIDLDARADFQPFYMNNPLRLVIDMSKTAFRFQEPELIKPRGLVEELRYGTMARGRSRIVMSLTSPVKIFAQLLQQTEEGRYRYTLDLARTSLAEFERQITSQRNTVRISGNVASKGDRLTTSSKRPGRVTIVLDPGHGGIDGGANGKNDTVEKDLTLEIAIVLGNALKKAGPFDVFLTREEDYFMSLKERLEFTMRKRADLFISIHTDALEQKDVRGAAVYTLSREASDELSKKLAETKNQSDVTAGLAGETSQDLVTDILDDLAARETKKFSIRFARQIIKLFGSEIKLLKNPHRFAAFGVLKDPNVPSVLLELGYLSNLEDEKLLQSDEWRTKVARHMAQAVEQFFANRIQ